ncbi:hypothetical protein HDU96_010766 [Phlyctochytrium bullatum]|nr:hypothetical protein HDU96_010766 [Phlyctochytrium bullatum]
MQEFKLRRHYARIFSAGQSPMGKVELLSVLGKGTYGTVFKGRLLATNEIVAIKVVRMKEEEMKEIVLEMDILEVCHHHNVTSFRCFFVNSMDLWICMEFCDAGTLFDILHGKSLALSEVIFGGGGDIVVCCELEFPHLLTPPTIMLPTALPRPFSEEEISAFLFETLLGLAYLHSKAAVIHRDLKAGNILLTTKGEVKLADFGVSAKLRREAGSTHTFIGTPNWMAPEVIRCNPDLGPADHACSYGVKADIWSLGVTAIELVDKWPPLCDLHPASILVAILHPNRDNHGGGDATVFEPKNPEAHSAAFCDFVKACLIRDPAKRPGCEALLRHPLFHRWNGGQHGHHHHHHHHHWSMHHIHHAATKSEPARRTLLASVIELGLKHLNERKMRHAAAAAAQAKPLLQKQEPHAVVDPVFAQFDSEAPANKLEGSDPSGLLTGDAEVPRLDVHACSGAMQNHARPPEARPLSQVIAPHHLDSAVVPQLVEPIAVEMTIPVLDPVVTRQVSEDVDQVVPLLQDGIYFSSEVQPTQPSDSKTPDCMSAGEVAFTTWISSYEGLVDASEIETWRQQYHVAVATDPEGVEAWGRSYLEWLDAYYAMCYAQSGEMVAGADVGVVQVETSRAESGDALMTDVQPSNVSADAVPGASALLRPLSVHSARPLPTGHSLATLASMPPPPPPFTGSRRLEQGEASRQLELQAVESLRRLVFPALEAAGVAWEPKKAEEVSLIEFPAWYEANLVLIQDIKPELLQYVAPVQTVSRLVQFLNADQMQQLFHGTALRKRATVYAAIMVAAAAEPSAPSRATTEVKAIPAVVGTSRAPPPGRINTGRNVTEQYASGNNEEIGLREVEPEFLKPNYSPGPEGPYPTPQKFVTATVLPTIAGFNGKVHGATIFDSRFLLLGSESGLFTIDLAALGAGSPSINTLLQPSPGVPTLVIPDMRFGQLEVVQEVGVFLASAGPDNSIRQYGLDSLCKLVKCLLPGAADPEWIENEVAAHGSIIAALTRWGSDFSTIPGSKGCSKFTVQRTETSVFVAVLMDKRDRDSSSKRVISPSSVFASPFRQHVIPAATPVPLVLYQWARDPYNRFLKRKDFMLPEAPTGLRMVHDGVTVTDFWLSYEKESAMLRCFDGRMTEVRVSGRFAAATTATGATGSEIQPPATDTSSATTTPEGKKRESVSPSESVCQIPVSEHRRWGTWSKRLNRNLNTANKPSNAPLNRGGRLRGSTSMQSLTSVSTSPTDSHRGSLISAVGAPTGKWSGFSQIPLPTATRNSLKQMLLKRNASISRKITAAREPSFKAELQNSMAAKAEEVTGHGSNVARKNRLTLSKSHDSLQRAATVVSQKGRLLAAPQPQPPPEDEEQFFLATFGRTTLIVDRAGNPILGKGVGGWRRGLVWQDTPRNDLVLSPQRCVVSLQKRRVEVAGWRSAHVVQRFDVSGEIAQLRMLSSLDVADREGIMVVAIEGAGNVNDSMVYLLRVGGETEVVADDVEAFQKGIEDFRTSPMPLQDVAENSAIPTMMIQGDLDGNQLQSDSNVVATVHGEANVTCHTGAATTEEAQSTADPSLEKEVDEKELVESSSDVFAMYADTPEELRTFEPLHGIIDDFKTISPTASIGLKKRPSAVSTPSDHTNLHLASEADPAAETANTTLVTPSPEPGKALLPARLGTCETCEGGTQSEDGVVARVFALLPQLGEIGEEDSCKLDSVYPDIDIGFAVISPPEDSEASCLPLKEQAPVEIFRAPRRISSLAAMRCPPSNLDPVEGERPIDQGAVEVAQAGNESIGANVVTVGESDTSEKQDPEPAPELRPKIEKPSDSYVTTSNVQDTFAAGVDSSKNPDDHATATPSNAQNPGATTVDASEQLPKSPSFAAPSSPVVNRRKSSIRKSKVAPISTDPKKDDMVLRVEDDTDQHLAEVISIARPTLTAEFDGKLKEMLEAIAQATSAAGGGSSEIRNRFAKILETKELNNIFNEPKLNPEHPDFDQLHSLKVIQAFFNAFGMEYPEMPVVFKNMVEIFFVSIQSILGDAMTDTRIPTVADPIKKILFPIIRTVQYWAALTGRTASFKEVQGTILHAGMGIKEIKAHHRGEIHYAEEGDPHFPSLTVKQTLEFVLNCRFADAFVRERVLDVTLKLFGLTRCKDTVVGDHELRGVSGGEKKRVSLAGPTSNAVQYFESLDPKMQKGPMDTKAEFVTSVATKLKHISAAELHRRYSESDYGKAMQRLVDEALEPSVVQQARKNFLGNVHRFRNVFGGVKESPTKGRGSVELAASGSSFVISLPKQMALLVHRQWLIILGAPFAFIIKWVSSFSYRIYAARVANSDLFPE